MTCPPRAGVRNQSQVLGLCFALSLLHGFASGCAALGHSSGVPGLEMVATELEP